MNHKAKAKKKVGSEKWTKEFKDVVRLMPGKIGNCGIYLSLENGRIWELVEKYLGDESKVMVKARKGKITIEEI